MSVLGNRIKKLRKEKGLTQEELGNKVGGFNKSTVSQWESGERIPEMHTIEKLVDFFNTSVDYLLGRTDIREPRGAIIDLEKGNHQFVWKDRMLTAEEMRGLLVGEDARNEYLLKQMKKQTEKK